MPTKRSDLVNIVHRLLKKRPSHRFARGKAFFRHIWQSITTGTPPSIFIHPAINPPRFNLYYEVSYKLQPDLIGCFRNQLSFTTY
ncbi:MAG: hypothetical protein JWO06_2127 [Bacteroidota bacterium]|nr:hypothetical protein [Bacteroidota bacterium]